MSHYDRTKSIKFNFYNNLATPSNLENRVHYLYKGKENQPNVVFVDSGKIQTYTAHDLYIFKNNENGGELVIENKPITNYGKSLFLSFPLIGGSKRKTDIDNLIDNKTRQEVDLNTVLPEDTSCSIKENMEGIHLKFLSPINIQSNLSNLLGNPNVIEGMTIDDLSAKFNTLESELNDGYTIECTEVDIDGEPDSDAMYRIPLQNKKNNETDFVFYFFTFILVIFGSYGLVGLVYYYILKRTFKDSQFDLSTAKSQTHWIDKVFIFALLVTLLFTHPTFIKDTGLNNKQWFVWSLVAGILYVMSTFFLSLSPSMVVPNTIVTNQSDELEELFFIINSGKMMMKALPSGHNKVAPA